MTWIVYLCGVAVIAGGLVAGVFLAFSDFVMRSLGAAEPAGGIEAMQIINRKVYRSVFLVLVMGMASVCAVLGGVGLFQLSGAGSAWIIGGSGLYLVGVFLVTLVCNVPMNKRLDGMDRRAAETEVYWRVYVARWTMWNHVRTVASAGSTVCFLVGILLLVGG